MIVEPHIPSVRESELEAERDKIQKEFEEFVSITAHDLKEPLRGILTYINFIFEDHPEQVEGELGERLEKIKDQALHATELVEILRDYARLGMHESTRSIVDLDAVVADCLSRLGPEIERQGTVTEVVGRLPSVYVSPQRAASLIHSLLENGVRYNDKPEKLLQIGIDGADDQGWPIIFVRDNGIGIPERHQAKVFKLFKRVASRSKFGAAKGIGLSFAKKIIEGEGGWLEIESEQQVGTTVRFTLPPAKM